MDPSRFTEQKTGEVIRIADRLSDWAFVPDSLPPKDWSLPSALNPLLRQAASMLGKLDGIGRLLTTPDLLLRPLRTREAITSSSIEGTYASAEELLLFAQSSKAEKAAESDTSVAEVFNYGQALAQGWTDSVDKPVSLSLIRAMHTALLGGVRGKGSDPGNFRRLQVCVGSDARYAPPPAQHLPDLLGQFQTYINTPTDSNDPLVRCFLAHYQFETIHPFLDGNGRVGRALLAIMIGHAEQHRFPWLYLSPYFERFKSEYVEHLLAVSTHGHWTQWVEFCLRGTIQQAEDAVRRCERLLDIRKGYYQRVGGERSGRIRKIIDDLFDYPFISIVDLAKKEGVTYPTAKDDVEWLVKMGILRKLKNHRPTTYYSSDVFDVAYSPSGEIRPAAKQDAVSSANSTNE